ncbi:MAG: hypothetical protein WAX89_05445 [Alphaproteobacteria bacterium]
MLMLSAASLMSAGIVIGWVGFLFILGQLEPARLHWAYTALPHWGVRLCLVMATTQFFGVWLMLLALRQEPNIAGVTAVLVGAIIPIAAAMYITGVRPNWEVYAALITTVGVCYWLHLALQRAST